MSSKTITIEVPDEIANAYEKATAEDRKKIDLLLRLRVRDVLQRPKRTLLEVMDEMGREAAERGLTPEILDDILNER
jgi:hypothetical protein